MSDNYTAIEVKFKLSAMALPSMAMHLDDLIAAGAIKKFISQSNNELINDYDAIIHHLPVEKYIGVDDNDWVYKASRLKFTQVLSPFMRSISQRINKREFALHREEGVLNARQNTLNEVSGAFKASIDLIPSAAYVEATGYCIGDIDKVKELLSYIKNVGKKHNRGQGKIIDFDVLPFDKSENDLFWTDRYLPITMKNIATNDHVLATNVATKPPYWKNKKVGFVIT